MVLYVILVEFKGICDVTVSGLFKELIMEDLCSRIKCSRSFNHYGDGGIGFPPHFDHDVTHRGRLKTWFSIQR